MLSPGPEKDWVRSSSAQKPVCGHQKQESLDQALISFGCSLSMGGRDRIPQDKQKSQTTEVVKLGVQGQILLEVCLLCKASLPCFQEMCAWHFSVGEGTDLLPWAP